MKFWLDPIALAGNQGLRPDLVRRIERLVYEHATFLKENYDEYHQA